MEAVRLRTVFAAAAILSVALAAACTTASATPTPDTAATVPVISPSPATGPTVEPTAVTPVATNTPLPGATATAVPTSTTLAIPATPVPSPTPRPTSSPTASPTLGPGAEGGAISAFPVLEIFPAPIAHSYVVPPVPEGPFPTPTARPPAASNLAPRNAGLTLSGAEPSGEYLPENVRISWSVGNSGPFTTNEEFNVEVRLDGTTLAQWTAQGLATNSFIFIDDAPGLLNGIRITPGTHEISLVIDSLDSVVEVSETDNTMTRSITMIGSEPPVVSPDLLPNLVPAPKSGKTEPIFVSTHADDPLAGKLSVDFPAYLAVGATNSSIQYITQNVELDLYFDDKLVRRLVWGDLGADEAVQFVSDDLRGLVDIAPGPHTLRLVVDPLDRIPESDETDNEYTVVLVWGIGDVPPADEPFVLEPPLREPTTRANLTPFRPFGWSSGISASVDNLLVPVGTDGWLEAGKATRIDFAFTNASRFSLPLTDQLKADVLVDGQFVEQRNFNSGSSNTGLIWKDNVTLPAGSVTPGEHTIRVVLDPDGLFDELSEVDNIFERTFTWNDGPDPDNETTFEMSQQEISDAFAPLFVGMRREVKPVLGPGSGERDWTPEIRAAGRAVYYLLTGRDVNEEGYVLNFLSPEEFAAQSTATCMSRWITMTVSEYENAFDICTEEGGEIGFKTRSNGQIHLFVDLGLSPLDALGTYLHELGHGLQDLRNPGQTGLPFTLNVRGLFEAQAQIFEAAGWRAIEESTGQQLSLFPDVVPARDRFAFVFNLRRTRMTEHDVGYRLLWTEALTSAGNPAIAEQLRTTGKLDSAGAMWIYDKMVDMFALNVSAWAAGLLTRDKLMDEFEQIAALRFETNLPVESTGHTALQDAAWNAP